MCSRNPSCQNYRHIFTDIYYRNQNRQGRSEEKILFFFLSCSSSTVAKLELNQKVVIWRFYEHILMGMID